ncbi:hypothetical protein LCGC14_0666990 [marine sediment metagenome]|uniref:Uncharacterized protein n=1 Tax=marine sediment metagenome TaxID=412755 RepID=A0A0F9RC35_9ZZZZ
MSNKSGRATKREEAEARQVEYNTLTPKEKLSKLDKKLGKDIGAKKERARLHKLINKST